MAYTTDFETFSDADACAKCGRDRDLVTHDLGAVCPHCATEANVPRAAR
jgi:hypothetical protein